MKVEKLLLTVGGAKVEILKVTAHDGNVREVIKHVEQSDYGVLGLGWPPPFRSGVTFAGMPVEEVNESLVFNHLLEMNKDFQNNGRFAGQILEQANPRPPSIKDEEEWYWYRAEIKDEVILRYGNHYMGIRFCLGHGGLSTLHTEYDLSGQDELQAESERTLLVPVSISY